MPKHVSAPSRNLLVLFTVLFGFAFPTAAATQARLSESYGKLPLHFEANQGQTHEDVRFLARGPGYGLYLTAGEAVLVLTRPSPDENGKRNAQASPGARAQGESVALRMSLVGAARKPLVSGLDELPGKANYFIGKDQSKWRTNVPTYAKVHYREVYPGIDLLYYGNQRQLEYDFVVAPGADPKKIVLGFKGAEKIEIDAQGDLVLHAGGSAIRQHKPVIYQEVDGVRQEVAGSYVRKGANQIGFKVAAYDTSRPLVIDPVVLSYSTYLGGSGYDQAFGIAVDVNGNAYVTGQTGSLDFPTTAGAFQPTSGGGLEDAFVTKLDPTGSTLVYSTYLGGRNHQDYGFSIAVDAAGNAYITGGTHSTDFPTTPEAFQTIFSGSVALDAHHAFVAKLDPTGSVLVYSTYLGGSQQEYGIGIAIDGDGNAYVTGGTRSTDFPTTPGAFQVITDSLDAFVAKLNPTGSALVYSTYLGGSNFDSTGGIAVDANGNAYVTGVTGSIDFPTTPGAFQASSGGSSDAFVTKLDANGSALIYSTYLGGTGADSGSGIGVDANGNAYMTGVTFSANFPTMSGAYQPGFGGGGGDAFVTKLDPTGSALVYSTYLGGSYSDGGRGITVDAASNAYVTGTTGPDAESGEPPCSSSSSNPGSPCFNDFPITVGAFQPNFGGLLDAFVARLDPTGLLDYSTYLGGNHFDYGSEIAVDAGGHAYVTGETRSSSFPTTSDALQPTIGGGGTCCSSSDAFVAKFSFPARFEESAATYSGYWPSYGAEMGTFSGGTLVASNQTAATATFSFTGTAVTWIGVKCSVCGIATVSIDGGAPYLVDTAGPASSNFTSEPVFSASGLAPEVQHTLVITVTGTSTSLGGAPLTGGTHIAVDAFDVTR